MRLDSSTGMGAGDEYVGRHRTRLRHLGGLACVLALAAVAAVVASRTARTTQGAQGPGNLRRIVIGLHVYEVGQFREIPPIDWGDGVVSRRALCFDKPALDLVTRRPIGEVTECFAEVVELNGAYTLRNVTFIKLPEGTIVARHRTTFQPMLGPDSPATHIVGACPEPGDLNVIEATGRFKGAVGQVRVVGLVDLENFRPDAESGVKFHEWVYLIQLFRRGREPL